MNILNAFNSKKFIYIYNVTDLANPLLSLVG
jgi:hypothetical protein